MKVIKEALAALTTEDGNIVRVNSKEHTPMSDSRFKLIVGSLTKVGLAHAAVQVFTRLDADLVIPIAFLGAIIFGIPYVATVCSKHV